MSIFFQAIHAKWDCFEQAHAEPFTNILEAMTVATNENAIVGIYRTDEEGLSIHIVDIKSDGSVYDDQSYCTDRLLDFIARHTVSNGPIHPLDIYAHFDEHLEEKTPEKMIRASMAYLLSHRLITTAPDMISLIPFEEELVIDNGETTINGIKFIHESDEQDHGECPQFLYAHKGDNYARMEARVCDMIWRNRRAPVDIELTPEEEATIEQAYAYAVKRGLY